MIARHNSERYLAYLFTIAGFASLICVICSAIVWLHWRVVLNTCAGNFQTYASYYDERDCGCILYGKTTASYFVGSHVGFCYWATFGPILPLVFCFFLGIYHVFRVCCKSNQPQSAKMHMRHRSRDEMQLTIQQDIDSESNDISPYYWTPVAIIAFLMVLYCLVHSIMLTDGMLQTCKQYRNEIIKRVYAGGEMVAVIQGRLSCTAVFDFMDYIHGDLSLERRRDYRINTAIPFIMAVVFGWVAVACWIGLFTIAIIRCRQSRPLRV